MKSFTLIALLSVCMFYSCNKKESGKPIDAETLLIRPDTIRYFGANNFTYANFFTYDNKGRYLGLGGLMTGVFYTYDNNDQVSTIKSVSTGGSNNIEITTKVYYQNGVPAWGSLKYYAVNIKDVNPQYWTDSIQYTLPNNKVTQIRYFDRRYYDDKTKQLIRLEPGTTATYTVSYERNNLKKLEKGTTVLWDAAYGIKKGYFAADRFKFFLFYGENPELHSENDISTVTQPSSISAWQKLTYTYQYNSGGYPKTAELNVVQSDGRNSYSQSVKYLYK